MALITDAATLTTVLGMDATAQRAQADYRATYHADAPYYEVYESHTGTAVLLLNAAKLMVAIYRYLPDGRLAQRFQTPKPVSLDVMP